MHATVCVVCWVGGATALAATVVCVCVGGSDAGLKISHPFLSLPHFLSSPPPRPLFNHPTTPTPTMALTSRPTLRTVCRRASVRVCAKGDGKRVDRSSKSDVM